ncbi:unnamed protein product [Sphagnum balticum]
MFPASRCTVSSIVRASMEIASLERRGLRAIGRQTTAIGRGDHDGVAVREGRGGEVAVETIVGDDGAYVVCEAIIKAPIGIIPGMQSKEDITLVRIRRMPKPDGVFAWGGIG